MKKRSLSLTLVLVMLLMAMPAIASAAATTEPTIDAILAEYERWGSVPYEQRTDYPKNLRIPFKTMWVVYTNMIVFTDTLADAKEYYNVPIKPDTI